MFEGGDTNEFKETNMEETMFFSKHGEGKKMEETMFFSKQSQGEKTMLELFLLCEWKITNVLLIKQLFILSGSIS